MKMSKSEKLLEEILIKIKSIDHFSNLYRKEKNGTQFKDIKREIEQLIMQLYDQSIKDNFYYLDCPVEVYKNIYDQRLEGVQETFSGISEVFFLKTELEDLLIPEYKFSKTNLSEFRNYCQNTFYKSSFIAKIEFIRNKLLSLGHVINISPEVNSIPKYNNFSNQMYFTVDCKYDPSYISKVVVNSNVNKEKLEWIGNASHLGFIIGTLIDKGFIKPSLHKSGDINYNKLARLVKQSFINDSKATSLSKYLNLNSEKSQETKRALEEYDFLIPDIKEVTKSKGKKRSRNN